MKIFLAFDVVLRRVSSPKSELDSDCVSCFEQTVLAHPKARIVIASTWRLVHRLDALRQLFSEAFAQRVEGVTPDLPNVEEFVRQAEITAYLNRNNLRGTSWIAVDDDPEGYRPGAPIIQVNPALGFNAECSRKLTDWIVQCDRRAAG